MGSSNAFARLYRSVARHGLPVGRHVALAEPGATRPVDARVRRAAAAEVLPLEQRVMFGLHSLGAVFYANGNTGCPYTVLANDYEGSTPGTCACQADGVQTNDGKTSTKVAGPTSTMRGQTYDAGLAIVSGVASGQGGTGTDFGNETVANDVPMVVGGPNGPAVIDGPTSTRYFEQVSAGGGSAPAVYRERYGATTSLVETDYGGTGAGNSTGFALTEADGTVWSFHGIYLPADGGSRDPAAGEPASETSPGGLVTSFAYVPNSGSLSTVTRTSGSVTERFTYTHITTPNDPNLGKISSVELDRNTGPGGQMVAVQSGLYTYYAAQNAFGNPGDLETATIVDGDTSSAASLGTSYYRYQGITIGLTGTESDGTPVGYQAATPEDVLGLAYGPASFARLAAGVWPATSPTSTENTANLVALLDTLSDSALTAVQSPDVQDAYEATPSEPGYSTGRIASRTVQGAGCSACSGGLGTTTYQYVASPAGLSSPGYNTWATEAIVGVPYTMSGSTPVDAYEYTYYNGYGQPMLDVRQVVTTGSNGQVSSRYEGTFTHYDQNGEPTFVASPSAVALPYVSPTLAPGADPWTSTLEANPDLLGQTSGPGTPLAFAYVAAHAGLVTTTTYTAASDTAAYAAGTSVAAAVAGITGEVEVSTAVQEGDAGTPVPKEAWRYTYRTGTAGLTIPLVASDTTYGLTGGADARATTYGYVYPDSQTSGTFQPYEVTVTTPSVAAAQNGTGATQETDTVFDTAGRPVWQRDAGRYITYTAYNDATGAMTEQIANVDTSSAAYAYSMNVPPTWATPANAGQTELLTAYTVDDQGRTTEEVTPDLRATYTVYNDTSATAANPGPGGVRGEVRTYAGWANGTETGPTQVTREVWPVAESANSSTPTYAETLTTDATPTTAVVDGVAVPTGAEDVAVSPTGTGTAIQSLTRDVDNSAGQVVEEDRYFSLAGATYTLAAAQLTNAVASNDSSTGNYHRTTYQYEFHGWQDKVVEPTGTIDRTVYDTAGEVTSKWVGTDDTPTDAGTYWSPSQPAGTNLVDVEDDVYDRATVPPLTSLSLSQTTPTPGSSGVAQGGLYYVEVTYTFGSGSTVTAESAASGEASYDLSPGYVLHVAAPPAVTGATGYNVYVSTTPGGEQLQTTSGPVLGFTSGWTQASDGSLNASGVRPAPGTVGDGNLTSATAHPTPGTASADRTTLDLYDWQDRLVATKSGAVMVGGVESTAAQTDGVHRPITYTAVDNAGEAVGTYGFDGDAAPLSDFLGDALAAVPVAHPTADSGLLRAASAAAYDDQGRAYRSVTYPIDQTAGGYPTVGTSPGLTTNTFYDTRADVIETAQPGGMVTKAQYDGNGWTTLTSMTDGGQLYDAAHPASTPTYLNPAYAGSVADDVVLGQATPTYDKDGDVVLAEDSERFDNDPTSATGNLAGPGGGYWASRDSYDVTTFDAAGRQTTDADLGTNGGNAYTSGATPSAPELVTQTIYGPNGLAQYTVDPMEYRTAYVYDLMGRTTATVANYSSGSTAPLTLAGAVALTKTSDSNQTTTQTYDGNGDVLTMTAFNSGAAPTQTTAYVYGVTTAGGSAVNDDDLLAQVQYPDPLTGLPEAGVGWTFDTSTGVSASGTYFTQDGAGSPEGSQVGFVQMAGAISQSVDLAAGSYTVSFVARQRAYYYGSEPVQVLVDGNPVQTYTPPSSTAYTADTTPAFTIATPGPHTITFQGIDADGGDHTVFLDNVQLHNAAGGSAPELNDYGFESPSAGTGPTGYVYDPATGVRSQDETSTYDAAGDRTGYVDENGTVHAYRFDTLGRQTADVVTSAAPGVDTTVLALGWSYDTAGRPYQQTSYNSSTSLTAAATVNQVQDAYNDFGQLTAEYQAVTGPVNTASTPAVRYAYADAGLGANDSRLRSVTYPDGRAVDYTYGAGERTASQLHHSGTTVTATVGSTAGLSVGEQVVVGASVGNAVGYSANYFGTFTLTAVNPLNSTVTYSSAGSQTGTLSAATSGTQDITITPLGLDQVIARPDGLRDQAATAAAATPLESDAYLGTGTVVARAQGDGDELAYNLGTGANRYGSALDQYGRVTDQNWVVTAATGTSVDREQLGYDPDGDVLYKNNTTGVAGSTTRSEAFTYDGRNRLVGFARGTFVPASGSTPATVSSPSTSSTWSLDALGNWASTTTAAAGSPTPTTTARTNDARNRVTANGAAALSYDADGNTLNDGSGKTFAYDAWNRIATVTLTAVGDDVYIYRYLPGGQQASVVEGYYGDPNGGPTVTYFDAAGRQVQTGTLQGTVADEYVWGLGYVNELVERDGSGGRLYAMQDANYNLTSVANASGGVAERFAYDPYGTRTVLTAGYAAAADAYAFQVGFQGGVQDATTGLIRFGARDYSPTLGRWMEQDPAGYVDGANRYQSDDSDPIGEFDPAGLAPPSSKPATPPTYHVVDPGGLIYRDGPTGSGVGPWPTNNQGEHFRINVNAGATVQAPGYPPNDDAIVITASGVHGCKDCFWLQFTRDIAFGKDGSGNYVPVDVAVSYPFNGGLRQANTGDWGIDTLPQRKEAPKYSFPMTASNSSSGEFAFFDAPYQPVLRDFRQVSFFSQQFKTFLVCDGQVKYEFDWQRNYNRDYNNGRPYYHAVSSEEGGNSGEVDETPQILRTEVLSDNLWNKDDGTPAHDVFPNPVHHWQGD